MAQTAEERLRKARIWKAKKRGAGLLDADGRVLRLDRTALRDRIEQEVRGNGAGQDSFDAMTVMHRRHDPYRIDNPAGHRNGRWFRDQIDQLLGSTATIHLRGLHYVLVTAKVAKPHDGKIYINTDANFQWLVEHSARHARWLGYVDFERIIDERNAPPEVFCQVGSTTPPLAYMSQGAGMHVLKEVLLPSLDSAMPSLRSASTAPRQPYRIVMIGEKVSLKPILRPIAERIGGEVILPTGELSDTLLAAMVRRAAEDGRAAVVLYFSDFDPSGYHMPVAVARKVQTLCDLRYRDLDIAIYPVALNFRQVTELGLPSTPLKPEESRADKWKAYWGREQTEIDALAALQPDVLRGIAEAAITPFYDRTLNRRWHSADTDWQIAAMRLVRAHPLYESQREAIGNVLSDAEAAVGDLQDIARMLDEAQRAAVAALRVAIPDLYEMPSPEITTSAPEPLYWSGDDWREATEKLIAYRDLVGDLSRDEAPATC